MSNKIEKQIDLSNLPKRGKLINWKESIGCKCKFKYNDIEGEVEIVGYNSPNLIIKYLDYDLFEINYSNFSNCQFGKLLKIQTNKFKVNIGQTFKDYKRDFTIIDKECRPQKVKNGSIVKWKHYKYHCNKCGNEDWIEETQLITKNSGCNVCCYYGSKAKLGFNTIYDKARWMCDLGVSEEDAKKYTPQSNKKIIVKCPACGKEKEIKIDDI